MNTRRFSTRIAVALAVALTLPAHAQLRVPQQGATGVAPPSPGSPRPSLPPSDAARPSDSGGSAGAVLSGPRPVDRIVAVVNREAITENELDQRLRTVARRLRAQGAQLPPEEELRKQVLERMIVDRAQMQAARETGVRVDEPMIDRAIGRIAEENKLTVAQLRERLEADGMTFRSFRGEIAQEIALSRLRDREIDARIQVSEAEIDAFIAEQSEQSGGAKVEYDIVQITIRLPESPPEELVAQQRKVADLIVDALQGSADPGRVAAEFANRAEGVAASSLGLRPADRLPELFVKAVERLRPGEVSQVVRSPAGLHVLKLIDRRGGGFAELAGTPVQQSRARHILLRVDEVNPEADVLRRLREIRERIVGGTADFADMARQYSADGTARQGGDLGWIYPGDTVPEFERAMTVLQPNEVSEPIRTPFGYHLIQVVERRIDEASPDRIRAVARAAIRERKSNEAYQEWQRQIRDRAYVEYRLEER
jgi:peptidyl-prolyl cis-trans isomerase SurA